MKKVSILALAALCLTSCWTSIFTVAPTVEPVAPPKTVYTTQVTTPAPKVTTVTTVTVTNFNDDLSFYLDLNAVAAAFAESRSVQEFERLLNSSRYMINNLDLNRDGWIDYLRVIETHRGYYHTLLIQACLAPSVFQDVATLVAEYRPSALYVEVIGDRWLYGPSYIVRPVFVKRPLIWDMYGHPTYAVWVSPYYYGYFPPYYTQPKPVYLTHYQAYVSTYMTNHHYCHVCDYPSKPYYNQYSDMTRSYSRNDYQKSHPNDSFEHRATQYASSTGGVSVRNAGQLRNEVTRQQIKDKEKENESSASTRTTGSTTASSTSGKSARSTGSSTSSPSRQTSSTTSSSATSSSTATTTSKTSTSSTKSSSTATSARSTNTKPSTTIESRVNKSGTTRTTVKTTDASGRTTSVRRETTPSRQTSSQTTSRSANTSSGRSSGSATPSSTSGSSTRSSGSSARQR